MRRPQVQPEPMSRRLGALARYATIAVLAAGFGPTLSIAGDQGSSIDGTEGRAGRFTIGTPILERMAEVVEIAGEPGEWRSFDSKDGTLRVLTDSEGTIERIEISDPRFFTERLIRPGVSTMEDVLRRYGPPTALQVTGSSIALRYHAYEFVIARQDATGPVTKKEFSRLLPSPLASIRLGGLASPDSVASE